MPLVDIVAKTVNATDSIDSDAILGNVEFIIVTLIIRGLLIRLMHVRWLYYTRLTQLLCIYNGVVLCVLVSASRLMT